MKITIKSTEISKQRTDCIVIGLFAKQKLSASALQLDKASGKYLSKSISKGEITGKIGECLFLCNIPGITASKILIIGCGEQKEYNKRKYLKTISNMCQQLKSSPCKQVLVTLPELNVEKLNLDWKLQQLIITIKSCFYSFTQLKSSKQTDSNPNVTIHIQAKDNLSTIKNTVKQANAIANGMDLAKDLGNLPGNIGTPSYLAKQANQLSKKYPKIKTKILNEAAMKKLGMNTLLSVSQGSVQPAKFIIMHYNNDKSSKPIVFVGKGVTFDAGGISIKPSANMDEMKFDMMGAASVFGCMQACAELNLPINFIGIVPSTENLPGGQATKPGDIITSMSGKTVEILNTDAEGRLILCDSLTYAERFKPKVVIDIATLTGAILVALGTYKAGLFSDDEKLVVDLQQAGIESNDPIWPMPMGEEYTEELKSNFADLANIGSRYAGSATAACFLAEFTKKYRWAHLDIAGIAWNSGKAKGATGRPVPLLMRYLLNQDK